MKMSEILKYKEFIYDHFKLEDLKDTLKITYYFEIPGLETFEPYLELPKKETKKINSFVEEMAFHIGLVELISYWKCCIPKDIQIKCGYLDETQKKWFKHLYYNGLGEFFYRNHLEPDEENFVTIKVAGEKRNPKVDYQGNGCMIGIGGGKDSCVSLELLKNEPNRAGFMINAKPVMEECAFASGLTENELIKIKRVISPNIIKLNERGFLNGHTPFSAMVAFVSVLTAYLNDKKYVVLSNESSANESNVRGLKVNHQYSKSYEFEKNFQDYITKYFDIDIHYFSFLRPLSEYQIGMLFSRMPQYHQIFKSCNPGSKETPWKWCGNCPKCLFVFSLLSPFLYKDKLIAIFGSDLFEKEELLPMFQELLGYKATKPFDCVGTFDEINFAITKTIEKNKEPLPYLLEYYKKNHFHKQKIPNFDTYYNKENSLNEHYEKVLKKAIDND